MTDPLSPREKEERSALAAMLYPVLWVRWAAVESATGSKRRQQLRRAAQLEVSVLAPLRDRGASCQNCGAYRQSHRPVNGKDCANLDRYHGYVRANMGDLCPHWQPEGSHG